MEIGPITAKGEIEMGFNQDMVAPNGVTQSTYKSVFSIQLESGIDGSVAAGRVGVSTSRRLLEGGAITNRRKYKNMKIKKRPQRRLNVDNSENSEAAKLAFTIEVSEHSSRAIKMKANFAQPGAVSALGPDEFSFQVKELSLFKTVADPKIVLNKKSFPGGDPSI